MITDPLERAEPVREARRRLERASLVVYAIDAAVETVLDAEAAPTEEKVEIARAALAHAAALVRGEADLEKMFAELADILEPAVPASGKWVSEVGGRRWR